MAAFDFAGAGFEFGNLSKGVENLEAKLWAAIKNLTYEAWESARLAFIDGAARAGYKGPHYLWDDMLARGRAAGHPLKKPAKPTEAGQSKAASRADKAAEIAGYIAQGETCESLLEKAGEIESPKERQKMVSVAFKVAETVTKAAEKAAQDAVSKARSDFETALKQAKADGLMNAAAWQMLAAHLPKKAAPAAPVKAKRTSKATV